jgi:hypothetical protein
LPGTSVKEILEPYFDARLELAARYGAAPRFEPELTLFAGRAAGIQATSQAKVEQATGGWFAGLGLGAMF